MSFLLFTADAAAAHGHEFSPSYHPSRYWSKRSPEPMNQRISWPSTPQETPSSTIPNRSSLSQRRPPRSKTIYYLAQPPPSPRHRRCKAERALIVQLQKLSNSSRPLPTYDVLPSAAFGSRLKQLGHCFNGSGHHDVVFMSAEQYETSEEDMKQSDTDREDGLDSRHVVASVSLEVRRRHSEDARSTRKTLIQFSDGHIWEVSPLISGGGYEFVMQDSSGNLTVAKWLSRPIRPRRLSSQGSQYRNNPTSEPDEHRFQFSILDNNTRKRPVLAWLNRQCIEILDRHSGRLLGSSANSPTSTPPSSVFNVDFSTDDGSQPMLEVSEELKTFIVVTGTWVALREGFTTTGHRLEENQSSSPKFPNTPSFRTKPRASSASPTTADLGNSGRIYRRGTLPDYQNDSETETIDRDSPQRTLSLGRRSALRRRTPEEVNYTNQLAPHSPPQPFEKSTTSHPRPRPSSFPASGQNPPSPTPGCLSRPFAGRLKQTDQQTELNPQARISISINSHRNSALSSGSSVPMPLEKPRGQRRRLGLRALINGIFKRSAQ